MSAPPEIPELAFKDPIAYSKTLPSIYHLSAPHGAITDDNHGAYVVIVAWIMLCFLSISVLTRLLTRTIPVITAGTDDILIGISMIFAIAQTAVIHRSATNGLGRPEDSLSRSLFTTYAKTYYTANLLFILSITFAKASLIFLIVRLSPARSVRRICYALLALVALWALIMFFLFAFQCALPSPWDYTQSSCPIDTTSLYYAFGATDILTDLLVTLLPAYVIWNVQIPLRKRITVIAVFASRLVVPLLAALRLSSLPHYLDRKDNRSWEAVTPQTWLQIVQCVSIITACIPCLKPFLESLESGFMDMSMTGHTGATYGGASSGSGNHGSGGTKKSKNGTGVESYALSSFNGGNGTGGEINVHGKAAERYAGRHTPNGGGVLNGGEKEGNIVDGRYLDVNASSVDSGLTRNASVTESERALTSKSSNDGEDVVVRDTRGYDFGELRGGRHGRVGSDAGGIRVTKEVEIRDEGSFDVRQGGYGRRW